MFKFKENDISITRLNLRFLTKIGLKMNFLEPTNAFFSYKQAKSSCFLHLNLKLHLLPVMCYMIYSYMSVL